MPRTKLQNKVEGKDKEPPKHLKAVKQESGGWKLLLEKGGHLPESLKGLYLTDIDAMKAAERYYAIAKR